MDTIHGDKISVSKVKTLVSELLTAGGFLENRNDGVTFKGNLPIRGIDSTRLYPSRDAATDAVVQTYFADELRKVA
jgi:hypothetical protein